VAVTGASMPGADVDEVQEAVRQFRELGRVLEEITRAVDPQVLADAPATVVARARPAREPAPAGAGDREAAVAFNAKIVATASADLLDATHSEDPDLVPHRHRSFRLSRGRGTPSA